MIYILHQLDQKDDEIQSLDVIDYMNW